MKLYDFEKEILEKPCGCCLCIEPLNTFDISRRFERILNEGRSMTRKQCENIKKNATFVIDGFSKMIFHIFYMTF